MATIIPGTGATLTGTTAESQAMTAILWLQSRESNAVANPTGEDRILGALDINTGFFAGTFRLPATQSINASGQLVIQSTPYLNSGAFSAGSDGTFKSTTIEGYTLEALMYLQFLESQPAKNPDNRNYVSGSYSADQAVYSGSFNLPFTVAIASDGSLQVMAVEYLLT